jgi:hypothetical protein
MSGSIGGMLGMGSNGLGAAGGASLPPGLLQMLMTQMQGGGGMTPGAAMMGGPQLMGGQRPMGPNPAPQMALPGPPQQMPGQLSSLTAPGANGAASPLMGLLAALKGGQSGVSPTPGPNGGAALPATANMPSWMGSNMPAWLQAMLHYGSYGNTGMGTGGGAPLMGPGGMLGGGT